jgi:signal transduction histidine kinase
VRAFCVITVFLTIGFAAICTAAEPAPRSVLLLDQGFVGSPWYDAYAKAFRSAFAGSSTAGVAIHVEHLDFGHFSGPQHEDNLRGYLQGKYRATPIGVIVAAGPKALEFALHVRGDLGTDVPVVFSIVDDATLARLQPANATGLVLQYTLRDQIASARALVPDLKHVALVGDRLETQSFMREFRRELPIFSAQLDFIDLTGMAIGDVKARVATLPENSAIVYTAINIDGAGVSFIPRDALVAIAGVANRPIVVDSETMLGYGGAGGYVASPTSIAEETALLVMRVLNGQLPSTIPATTDELKPLFDWRELKRWHVSEDRLPPGSEVRFRETTVWEQYKTQLISVVMALLLQAALITVLMVEHWRRRRAEEAARKSLSEALRLEELRAAQDRLVQAEKLASLGELTAGIAHEINSPVGTSLTIASTLADRCNAFANEQSSGPLRRSQLTEFIEINRDAAELLVENLRRAGGLVQSFKQVATNHAQVDRHSFDLKRATDQMLASLRSTSTTFEGAIKVDIPDGITMNSYAEPYGQVLTNLFLNAVTHGLDETKAGLITVNARQLTNEQVKINFSDDGKGMSETVQRKAFDPFFTTRRNQGRTGLGLHIAYNIVTQQLGGQITVRSKPGQGATFNILLPVVSPD